MTESHSSVAKPAAVLGGKHEAAAAIVIVVTATLARSSGSGLGRSHRSDHFNYLRIPWPGQAHGRRGVASMVQGYVLFNYSVRKQRVAPTMPPEVL